MQSSTQNSNNRVCCGYRICHSQRQVCKKKKRFFFFTLRFISVWSPHSTTWQKLNLNKFRINPFQHFLSSHFSPKLNLTFWRTCIWFLAVNDHILPSPECGHAHLPLAGQATLPSLLHALSWTMSPWRSVVSHFLQHLSPFDVMGIFSYCPLKWKFSWDPRKTYLNLQDVVL